MLVATAAQITGAIILIATILPQFLVAVTVISVVYVYAAIFYRSSARELKVSLYFFVVGIVKGGSFFHDFSD